MIFSIHALHEFHYCVTIDWDIMWAYALFTIRFFNGYLLGNLWGLYAYRAYAPDQVTWETRRMVELWHSSYGWAWPIS